MIFFLCVLVLFLPPKQQAANDNRGRDGVPRARRPSRPKLRILSLLTSLVLHVIGSSSLWILQTALSDTRAGEICPR